MPLLQWFAVFDNDLTGTIPTELGALRSTVRMKLRLDENQLTGTVPTELTNIAKLRVLRLSGNPGLNGTLPDFSDMVTLRVLALNGTNISGTIPSSICAASEVRNGYEIEIDCDDGQIQCDCCC